MVNIEDIKEVFDEEKKKSTPTNDVPLEDTFTLFGNKFADISKLILRDLNSPNRVSVFKKYKKDDIASYLSAPEQNEKNMRDAVRYIYNASSHFRRLIQYFVVLSDLAYIVSPYGIDTSKQSVNRTRKYYKDVLDLLTRMDIKTQFPQILTVCLREDVYYGTFRVTNDSVIIQQLPSDYCKISSIEENVPNVSFDFMYFDSNNDMLAYYPEEFRRRYDIYRDNRMKNRWQDLYAPNSFAVKCNIDNLLYAVPPFFGILREIYDLEDYKGLKLTRTALENYAMLVMNLEINDNGEWKLDYNKAVKFYHNLDSVLPQEVGSVLSPMPIQKISFEKSNVGDTNSIADAERDLYTAAGVSQLLFNSDKPSANALALSIKIDQSITFGIVKSIQCAVNRFIHRQPYGKNFKVTFLDCSPFNRKELGDEYLKACQYGLPMISYFAATQGMSQEEVDCMNFLESDVLDLTERFKPLRSSATLGADTGEAGAPEKEDTELTEQGEQWREDQ